jgi:hypothetical protein
MFKYDDQRQVFVSLHVAQFLRFEEWVSQQTFSSLYGEKYGRGFKKRTGYPLKFFFDKKDLESAAFLDVYDGKDGRAIRTKALRDVSSKCLDLCLFVKQGQFLF